MTTIAYRLTIQRVRPLQQRFRCNALTLRSSCWRHARWSYLAFTIHRYKHPYPYIVQMPIIFIALIISYIIIIRMMISDITVALEFVLEMP